MNQKQIDLKRGRTSRTAVESFQNLRGYFEAHNVNCSDNLDAIAGKVLCKYVVNSNV